jgi:hypothetical protein
MEQPTLAELDLASASDPACVWDKDLTDARITYAWNWFGYHASQRLQAFNFFLIIVAVLTSGYFTALDKDNAYMQIAVGLAGMVISYGFLALDFRNAQLVDDARYALRNLERALEMDIHRSDYSRAIKLARSELLFGMEQWPLRLSHLPLVGKPFVKQVPVRHTVHLRRIERFVLLLFFLGTTAGIVHAFQDNGDLMNKFFAPERPASTVVTSWPKH